MSIVTRETAAGLYSDTDLPQLGSLLSSASGVTVHVNALRAPSPAAW